MKELYEKPVAEFISFQISENIMDDVDLPGEDVMGSIVDW